MLRTCSLALYIVSSFAVYDFRLSHRGVVSAVTELCNPNLPRSPRDDDQYFRKHKLQPRKANELLSEV